MVFVAIFVKDRLLIAECDKHIPLFKLEDFNCEKYLHSIHDPDSIHDPEDQVQYFAQRMPEKIPDKENPSYIQRLKVLLRLAKKNEYWWRLQ